MNKFAKISAIVATASLIAGASSFALAATTAEVKSHEKSATVGTAIDDTAVTTKVKAALANDTRTSALDTHVETANGIVTLTGTVKTAEVAKSAEEVAKSVEGVKEVVSKLNVAQ